MVEHLGNYILDTPRPKDSGLRRPSGFDYAWEQGFTDEKGEREWPLCVKCIITL